MGAFAPLKCLECGAQRGGHYSINGATADDRMATVDDLRMMFLENCAGVDELNYMLLSTSGIHGSYSNLDGVTPANEPQTEDSVNDVTFLIIRPRLVQLVFGNVVVRTREELEWLRRCVTASLQAITKSQRGNT